MTVEPADDPTVVVWQRWRRSSRGRSLTQVGVTDLGYRDVAVAEVSSDPAEALEPAPEDAPVGAEVPATPAYRPRHAQPEDEAEDRPEPVTHLPRRSTTTALLPDRDLAADLDRGTAEGDNSTGAGDEANIRHQLSGLGAGWRAVNAVPVRTRGGTVDHVLIGPAGVFTLEVKHHPQAAVWVAGEVVKVNGFDHRYVKICRVDAQRAAKLLSSAAGVAVEVHGLVAVVGAQRGLTIKQQPRDGLVTVVGCAKLIAHLQGLPSVLDEPTVERVYEAARHLATWQPEAVARAEFG